MADVIAAVLAFPTIWLTLILSVGWIEDRIRNTGLKNSTASMVQFLGWAFWTAAPSVALSVFLYHKI